MSETEIRLPRTGHGEQGGVGFTASKPRFQPKALRKVLIANRGEIALRLIRSAKALNLQTVSIYTQEDSSSPHVQEADQAFLLEGKESQGKGYLDQDRIIEVCKASDVQCILPGYGFLSESPSFFEKVSEVDGLVIAGPRAETVKEFGLKHRAREMAINARVPCLPGSGLLDSLEEAEKEAERIGYPVMLKSTAGGGGLGLTVCRDAGELSEGFAKVKSRGSALFGDAGIFLEKYVEKGRHVEVQIFGNGEGKGGVVHFGERECSIQRRHQKVVEESPSPFVERNPGLREKLTSCAVSLGELAKYKSAGTIEMLVDDQTAEFYFLEVNTRLQVEHCVSELCYDIDLVALMLLQADYELCGVGGIPSSMLRSLQRPSPNGAAIEARLYAEDPVRDYAPTPGLLQNVEWATESVRRPRIDTWVSTGTRVSASYDPMLAKICVWSEDRDQAIRDSLALLKGSKVQGTPTNLGLLISIIGSERFGKGDTLTCFLDPKRGGFEYVADAVEVLKGGISTTVQDYPGRRGIGHGTPESGPMDHLSLRVANLLVGNEPGAEALEITLSGPELLFHSDAIVALAGAEMEMSLDGRSVESHTRMMVRKGSRLEIGSVEARERGCRSYLAIRGGFPNVASYLGSKSTTTALGVGGYQGRGLVGGDTIEIRRLTDSEKKGFKPFSLPRGSRIPSFFGTAAKAKSGGEGNEPWPIFCIPGPFDDDDFLTAKDREKLYGSLWKVSHQSARTGIRLEGQRLDWSRKDGGEGGSHPSNVLEFGYSAGGVNWNGDTPVILGVDGPDLGGLLISNTIISSEWRAGQIKPQDQLKFVPISFEQARLLNNKVEGFLRRLKEASNSDHVGSLVEPLEMSVDEVGGSRGGEATLYSDPVEGGGFERSHSVLAFKEEKQGRNPKVKLRSGGDRFLVVEYGEMTADIINRCRIELLVRELQASEREYGIVDLCPNMRSLTIMFDPELTSMDKLVERVLEVEDRLPRSTDVKIPTREWTLPVTFNDPLVKLAIDRYMETVRSKAIYLPDNKAYLAECNGWDSVDQVEEAVTGCAHLAVAVGFYFGTPILLPLDPRKRPFSQKYNPTRTWTPEGALGHGGSAYAIYGCDSPGGYPLIGRTLPTWSTYGDKPGFSKGKPWLFTNFDTVRFVEVDQKTYDKNLKDFKSGTYQWQVRETSFDVAEQSAFLESTMAEANEFRKKQMDALEKARLKEESIFMEWSQEKQKLEDEKRAKSSLSSSGSVLEGEAVDLEEMARDPKAILIRSKLSANVWKVICEGSQRVREGDKLVVLEAMKMEIEVCAPEGCDSIKAVIKRPGDKVDAGDVLLIGYRD
ncbi:putative methylcrotonoyl-CoA carboxylase [Violaceomyces palustris]|uniref:Methylcrotonoyl-CoA carboxylase n=1 Tax=Violaceomyces palustris TaxID=1673888 RepID=A0ACD0NPX1_9BASI|nr:putative methylcrotonoyl-CoA carboxylase [Violaceomyces palustris]